MNNFSALHLGYLTHCTATEQQPPPFGAIKDIRHMFHWYSANVLTSQPLFS